MTERRDPDAILAAWLDEGPDVLPESTRRAIDVTTRTTDQARRLAWLPWRAPNVNGMTRLALGLAAVLAVAVGGVYLLNPRPNGTTNVGAAASPSPSLSTPASPSASPTSSPAAEAPIDTRDWATFSSGRYRFDIEHPADWEALPSSKDWTMEADASNWLTSASDHFLGSYAGQTVLVTAFAANVPSGVSSDEWIADYRSHGYPYEGHTEAVCVPPLDEWEPVIVNGQAARISDNCGDSDAFLFVGSRAYVFTIWRPDMGSLLKAFLSTVDVTPAAPAGSIAIPAPS
jgi:hypothetical protein